MAPQASGRDPKGDGFVNEADNSSMESTRTESLAKGENHEKKEDIETKETNYDTENTTKEEKSETNVAAEEVEEKAGRMIFLLVMLVGRKITYLKEVLKQMNWELTSTKLMVTRKEL